MRWHGNPTMKVEERNKIIISHIDERQYVQKSPGKHIYDLIRFSLHFVHRLIGLRD